MGACVHACVTKSSTALAKQVSLKMLLGIHYIALLLMFLSLLGWLLVLLAMLLTLGIVHIYEKIHLYPTRPDLWLVPPKQLGSFTPYTSPVLLTPLSCTPYTTLLYSLHLSPVLLTPFLYSVHTPPVLLTPLLYFLHLSCTSYTLSSVCVYVYTSPVLLAPLHFIH